MMANDLLEPRTAAAMEIHGSGGLEETISFALGLVSGLWEFASPFDDLGGIDLPPVAGSPADQTALRAVAPLYLAAELESAGLLPAVEVLAGLFVSGGIQSDVGPAAQPLANFWRTRSDRYSPAERRGFFAHLFGSGSGPPLASTQGPNHDFENLFIDLAAAIFKLDESPLLTGTSTLAVQARIRTAANMLAANLIPRSTGLTAIAAHDVLETTQLALRVLKEPAVQHAVGASSLWLAVRNISLRYLETEPDVATHVARGKSGLLLLAWLADGLPAMDSPGGSVAAPGDPVVESAGMWLEASLALHEASTATGPRRRA